MGLIFGSTAKTVSPTSPREVDATPSVLRAIEAPVFLTTIDIIRYALAIDRLGRKVFTYT